MGLVEGAFMGAPVKSTWLLVGTLHHSPCTHVCHGHSPTKWRCGPRSWPVCGSYSLALETWSRAGLRVVTCLRSSWLLTLSACSRWWRCRLASLLKSALKSRSSSEHDQEIIRTHMALYSRQTNMIITITIFPAINEPDCIAFLTTIYRPA